MPQVISNDGTTIVWVDDQGQQHVTAANAISPSTAQHFSPASSIQVQGLRSPQIVDAQPVHPNSAESLSNEDVGRALKHYDESQSSGPPVGPSPLQRIGGMISNAVRGPGAPAATLLPQAPSQPQVQPVAPGPFSSKPQAAAMKPEDVAFLPVHKTPSGAKVFGGWDLEEKGIEDSAKAHAAGSAEAQKIYGELSAGESKIDEQHLKQHSEDDAAISAGIAKYGQMADDIANSRIDPDRLTHNMHTWQKILAGISIGLGAVGGAISHTGGNSALDIIEHAIDRDVDAQKAALQGKQAALANQLTLVGLYHQQGLTHDQAAQFTKLTLLDATEARMKEVMAGVDNADAIANMNRMLGEMKERRAQLAQQIEMQREAFALKAANNPERQKTAEAMRVVDDVSQEYFDKIGPGASVTQWFPSDAKKYEIKRRQAGELLHLKNPKLSADQWAALFPTPGTTTGMAHYQLQSLAKMIQQAGVGGNDMQPVDGEGE